MQSKFISVTTELLALACLMQGPTNAYGVMKTIEEHAIKGTEISHNQAFTALFFLCQKNYAKQDRIKTDCGERDIYTILPEGEAYYKSFLEDYNKHIKSVNQVLSVLKQNFIRQNVLSVFLFEKYKVIFLYLKNLSRFCYELYVIIKYKAKMEEYV